ncbi:MAG TPA: NAD(P)H-binding protein [Mycobacterium sp.]|jgi:NAD(P)-dependent dehydrogenase (short-subunit alcohol dehydrogenase family)|nr:NAD(P)H-binding protein [Mycobacterium sp.]
MVGQLRCLVTGATGYIGARLVPRLLDEDHRVRALARNPGKLADVPWREQVEPLPSDPDWAGEIVYTDLRAASTTAGPEEVWTAAEKAATNHTRWTEAEREPGTTLRLRSPMRGQGNGVAGNDGHAARRRRQQVLAAGDLCADRYPGAFVLVSCAAPAYRCAGCTGAQHHWRYRVAGA